MYIFMVIAAETWLPTIFNEALNFCVVATGQYVDLMHAQFKQLLVFASAFHSDNYSVFFTLVYTCMFTHIKTTEVASSVQINVILV